MAQFAKVSTVVFDDDAITLSKNLVKKYFLLALSNEKQAKIGEFKCYFNYATL